MAKRKVAQSAAEGSTLDLSSSGLQSFRMERMHRRAIRAAPYNPRTIGEAERRKLRAGIKRHGLVEPIVWNRKTGNIVGGHQRISQLDLLAGTEDYTLDVAVLDVDEGREKEINILLNNAESQGDWDMDKLAGLLRDSNVNLDGTGFDQADVFQMFGENTLIERGDPLDEFAAKIRAARDRYEQIAQNSAARDSENFYLVVVFRDEAQLDGFIKQHQLPDNRYQSGEHLMFLLEKANGTVEGGQGAGVKVSKDGGRGPRSGLPAGKQVEKEAGADRQAGRQKQGETGSDPRGQGEGRRHQAGSPQGRQPRKQQAQQSQGR
jgi:hypothetical protein